MKKILCKILGHKWKVQESWSIPNETLTEKHTKEKCDRCGEQQCRTRLYQNIQLKIQAGVSFDE